MKPVSPDILPEMPALLGRFLRYVTYDTQSSETSSETPSTEGQRIFLRMLYDELCAMPGVRAEMTPQAYVTAVLPGNLPPDMPDVPIGFIAHADTSPEAPGYPVCPMLVPAYDGTDIELPQGGVISPAMFPELLQQRGDMLVVSDGATLLGADDKAGVAEIMELMQYLVLHPEVRHGSVWVAFTPDEEIGRGTDHFPLSAFGAEFALTVDGGALGELQYENFNAAAANVKIAGRNIHPGSAKGKMLNALTVAMAFDRRLPDVERPEMTEGYEGFFHLMSLTGTVEHAEMDYIVRDHDRAHFEMRKQQMTQAATDLNALYGEGTVEVTLRDQYYNMKDRVLPQCARQIALVSEAMRQAGVQPDVRPIRGGTDGAMLSFKGLPCPNLFTGGHNFHGRYEYIPYGAMEKACEVLRRTVQLWAGDTWER